MKVLLNPASLSTVLGVAIFGVASFGGNAIAQTTPEHHESLPNIDARVHVEQAAAMVESRNAAKARLQSQLSGTEVSFDPLLDTPKFVRAKIGFLTGDNGVGVTVTPQAVSSFSANDPHRAVKGFLNEHSDLFGHGAEALQGATITRDGVTAHNGLRTVAWQQKLDGIPVFESVLIGNITASGKLVSIGSHFVPGVSQAADAGTPNRAALQALPAVQTSQAIVNAAQSIGESISTGDIVTQVAAGTSGYQAFKIGNKPAHSRQVWFPTSRGTLRLAWETFVTSHANHERFQVVVDAETGGVLLRRSVTKYISDATYNVYTSDSPSPFSPGHQTPSAVQPPLVNRQSVTWGALDVNASPNGWINDGDNETRGNNTDTFIDRDFDGQPDGGTRTTGNPNRVFDFPLDLTQAPLTYSNAAAVQMFYWVNWYHDRAYQLGFTESALNYQANNFGRGGLGGDEILSHVQAAADLGAANNAFFSPAPDGINGEIAMFVWNFPTPDRDGDLDAEVIIHEATHGLSWRLVGAGVGLGNLQSDGMGEGWSDFYAVAMLSQPSDDPDAAYAMGGYATYQLAGLPENYYFGIRAYPYCTDLGKNPLTFKDIDPGQASGHPGVPRSPISPFNPNNASAVHQQGQVWCVALWEVRANLIHKYGASANELMLQLVTDGMKLSPANPNFLEARDAILLADQVNNGGANFLDIWRGFAKRGMGYSATSPASTTTAGVVESFDLPGLQIAKAELSGGNGNGVIDFNECNDLFLILTNLTPAGLTNIQVTLSTRTPGVTLGNKFSAYPDMPSGSGGTNLIAFTISTAPFFICGTPIDLAVQIKSDEVTAVNTFTLSSGSPGSPVRFDNSTPAFIRDNDATGTNSFITVSNITSAVNKITVSMFLTHTFDSDLYFELTSPDGTTIMLSDHNGGGGDNFGASCAPDNFRTTFDDDAPGSITAGNPPFVGSFQPQQPLSVFIGKFGTNVNGLWKMHVVDDVGIDVGFLQCWSLNITVAQCVDGGGTCPGADLALGLTDAPDPVFVGSNLVYAISVTNNGPSEAKTVVVNQSLPPSVVFVSASSSVGNVTHAGGAVIANLGTLAIDGVATVAVTVRPTLVTTISSTASVSAIDVDPDPSNNSRTVSTSVNPVSSDIAVGIADSPDPALVGAALTYTVSVTNKGPATATGVFVTNTLPITAGFPVVSVSQGSYHFDGNKVVHVVGTLTNAGRATATITITPNTTGTLVATAFGKATQADPFTANNAATATTTVGPSANLALTLTDSPDPAVVNSNWIYTITVTNIGPSTASGVVVNQTFPASLIIVSATSASATITTNSGTVSANVNNLLAGSGAVIFVTVKSSASGNFASTATATAAQADVNSANNSATVSTFVTNAFISIATAGATLTSELNGIPNGSLESGETVTVELRLKNVGNVSTPALTATLLATNGVTSPVGTLVPYGVLTASGSAAGGSFSFTASGTNGGTVSATLRVFTNGIPYGNVAFNFTLPSIRTFSNTNNISITDNQSAPWPAGPAAPYPSSISVTGVTGQIGKITIALSGLSHTYPDDIDMLLVGPGGQKVLLMSDAGGGNGLNNVNVTFDDSATALSDEGQILSTSYHPADFESGDAFNAPAPAAPFVSSLSAFLGGNQNGTWSLYIMDDFTGDKGNIANGWSISFTTVTPINQIADIALIASVAPINTLVGGSFTNTLIVTNAGPNSAANVVLTSIVSGTAAILDDSASQGGVTTYGDTVTANLGTINAGSFATVWVVASPGLGALTNNGPNGVVISTASVTTTDTDPNLANNSGVAVALVTLPAADLAITQSISTNIVSATSNVVFTLDVTNAGPNTALSAFVTNVLPAGLTFVSSTVSVTTNSGTLVIALGNLPSGAGASFTITAVTASTGAKTNTASVKSSSSDAASANNTASLAFTVVAPSPSIIAAGALITSENVTANGAVDLGETVTVALSLRNVGNADTTNLRATLQQTAESKSYGVLFQGGASGAQSFTFTAPAINNGPVVATLALKDEKVGVTNDLGTVTFVFNLPSTTSYTNSTTIVIPDSGGAAPYPASITVSGLTGVVAGATVRLTGLTHGFPDDLDILLVGPAGQKILLMSDAGGGHSISGVALNFADGNADLPDVLTITSGNVKPTNYEAGTDSLPAPAPSGAAGTAFSVFNGSNPNGEWALYVADDSTGDAGSISGGWSLTLKTISVINPLADVSITMTAATDGGAPNPPFVGSALNYTIGVTNNGPATATAVTVTDTLPAGLTYINSPGGTHVSGVVTFNVGSLASGSGAGLTLRVTANTGSTVVNTASVTSAETDLTTANNSAQVSTTVRVSVAPTFSAVTITNSQTQFTLTGDAGMSYRILASTNLTTWTVLATTNAAPNGTIKFTDTAATNFSSRYYRAERVIP